MTRRGRHTRASASLFGERLNRTLVRQVEDRVRAADLLVVVGTSGQVWPVAGLPLLARDRGATTVLVNLEPWAQHTEVFDVTLLGDAAQVLPEALERAGDLPMRGFIGNLAEHALAGREGRTLVTHPETFEPGEQVLFTDLASGRTWVATVILPHLSDVSDVLTRADETGT